MAYRCVSQGEAMPFPLPFVPELSFKTAGRKFGAPRDGGKRSHAGCDLIADKGTEIRAIDDGIVYEASAPFYHGTNSMVVRHKSGIYVRYCEILAEKEILTKGTEVKAGEVIAKVGKMFVDSMLHFELYGGQAAGAFTQRGNGKYQRRSDLMDPTPLLEKLARELIGVTVAASK
jgi:murein DD-endopeptidase MepM/ murein hydrolase activator NlpD